MFSSTLGLSVKIVSALFECSLLEHQMFNTVGNQQVRTKQQAPKIYFSCVGAKHVGRRS